MSKAIICNHCETILAQRGHEHIEPPAFAVTLGSDHARSDAHHFCDADCLVRWVNHNSDELEQP